MSFEREPPAHEPCPVCEGAGYWDRLSGHPVYIFDYPPTQDDLLEAGAVRCYLCEGKRIAPPRTPDP